MVRHGSAAGYCFIILAATSLGGIFFKGGRSTAGSDNFVSVTGWNEESEKEDEELQLVRQGAELSAELKVAD
jgi:hypothetical protein